MTRKLVLIRHGEAEYLPDGKDFSRKLTESGKNQNAFIAHKVLEKDCCPEILISSDAPRALQTAEIFAEVWDVKKNTIIQNHAIYDAPLRRLLQIVAEMDNKYQHAVIFGHNPGLSNLAEYYTGFSFQLNTSSALVLEFETENWKEISGNSGKIILYLEP